MMQKKSESKIWSKKNTKNVLKLDTGIYEVLSIYTDPQNLVCEMI